MEIFSFQTTPKMKLSTAIRRSISYPIIFDKIDYQNNIYVDGGLINNYPIELFKDNMDKTLGICIYSSITTKPINDIKTYFLRILSILSSRLQDHMASCYKENTIEIYLELEPFNCTYDSITKKYIIDECYNQFKNKLFEKKIFRKYMINKSINIEVIEIVNNIIKNI